MSNRKYHYIYKITRDDGKYYIGRHSTDDISDGYFGSGQRLWKSIKKHGKEKHTKEILEYLPDLIELKKREAELVDCQTLNDPLCMNLTRGGDGGGTFIGNKARMWITDGETQRHHPRDIPIPEGFYQGMSQQTINKVAQSQIGKTRSQEAKDKTAAKHRGMTRNSESRAKMSISAKARTDRPSGSDNPLYGKSLSLDHKVKISQGNLGKKSKPISVNGVIYESLSVASRETGTPTSTLSVRAHRSNCLHVFYVK